MIYVVKTISEPAFIKVGFSKDKPLKRLKSIQTGCPFKLELLYVKKGSFIHEGIIHGNLRDFAAQGEWFHFTNECHEELLDVFKKFRFQNVSTEPPKARKAKDPEYWSKVEKTMAVLHSGVKTRAAATMLGIHKATVIRHSNDWKKRLVEQQKASP
jgi:hypothetical protein